MIPASSKAIPSSIRDASPADVPGIHAVVALATEDLRRIYRPRPAAMRLRAETVASLSTTVCVSGGKVVGCVQHRPEGGHLHLQGIYVHPGFRKRGIARGLIGFLEGRARSEGRSGLTLFAIRETGNVEVFERLGFRAVREEIADWAESDRFPTLTEVCMEKAFA